MAKAHKTIWVNWVKTASSKQIITKYWLKSNYTQSYVTVNKHTKLQNNLIKTTDYKVSRDKDKEG